MIQKILISLGAIAVVIVVAVVLLTRQATAPDETNTSASPTAVASKTPTPAPSLSPTASPQAGGVKSYTLADVAMHPNQASCWATINGSVYDLTGWIKLHPGGSDRILAICGKDGSSAFNIQHTGDQRPQDTLKTFFIGNLAQ